ncbi:MAG TPA: hypothetical protein VH701_17950 [Vicinamibacterales bacterium]|jgi:hypothetical protein
MRKRFPVSLGALAAAMVVVSLASVPLAGQDSAAAGTKTGAWTAPRTPWGVPDLQGVWTSDDMRGVPMQRPEQFGERRLLNDKEFAEREAQNQVARDREANRVGAFRNEMGTRSFRQTSLVIAPANGRTPALTPEADLKAAAIRARRGAAPASWEDRSLYDRCITRGPLGSILPVIYGNGLRIVQAPDYFVISYEMVHDTRVIPLDGRPHVGAGIRQYMGDARGRWEGDTLVVETRHFPSTIAIGVNGNGFPTTESLRLLERLTRINEFTINYEVTIDDPRAFTAPWTMLIPLTTQPGYLLLPYECHEGNLAMSNILSAARSWDKAAAEAAAKGLPPPASPWLGGLNPAQPQADPARRESEQ